MKSIKIVGTDQEIFFHKLKNGLKIILIPFENKKNYYASYLTKYGSVDLEFYNNENKLITSPKGVAHFLEHKLFETEEGEDPFSFFSKTGTGCNAGTSYKKTSYFIYGVNNLKENLDYLIDFVNKPYFTEENVEKEKGIIIEEIKMYDDNPDWIITEEIQKSTFKNHSIKYDIAGYIDTVNKITKEDLYECYNTFYQPSNMILVISGGFDKDDIIDLIENNETLNSRCDEFDIKRKQINEPLSIVEELKEIKHSSIVTSKIAVNVKISLNKIKDKYSYYIYINALISILFGSSSSFREEMLNKGYITNLSVGRMIVDNFLVIEYYAEGDNYKEFCNKVKETLKKTPITEDEFERYKKVLIASIVMASDNVEQSAEDIIEDIITWDRIIDNKIEIIKKLNFKEFKKIRETTDFSNIATVVLKPNN